MVNWFRRRLARYGRDPRWISNSRERDRHEGTVRERLARKHPVSVTEAAERLGVSAHTVRPRVRTGKLDAEYDAHGRISGVYVGDDQRHTR